MMRTMFEFEMRTAECGMGSVEPVTGFAQGDRGAAIHGSDLRHGIALVETALPIAKRLGFIVAVFALALVLPANAQRVSKVGTTAGQFLQLGVGARGAALGGAFVADASGPTALYWNAAGIARDRGFGASASHAEWLGETDFDHLAATFDVGGIGRAGIAITRLAVPDMLVRTEERQQGTGELFDASDLAIGLSFARAVTDRFAVGGTAKYIRQRIYNMSAAGAAFDLGVQFQTDFFGGTTIGASVMNFGTDMTMGGRDGRTFVDLQPGELGTNGRIPANIEMESHALPMTFQFGVAMHPMQSRMHQMTVRLDALHPASNYESLNAGAEYGFQNRVFLRGGYQGLFLPEGEGGLSGGLGVRQPLFDGSEVRVDYAYRGMGRLGGVHVVTLEVGV